MLRSLSISNFKSWRHIDSLELAPLTGLFGTNSSGKSSLLHLLLLLKRTAGSTDKGQILDFRKPPEGIDFGSFPEILYRHDLAKSLGFKLDWNPRSPVTIKDPYSDSFIVNNAKSIQFQCEIKQVGDGNQIVEQMEYCVGGHKFRLTRDPERREYQLGHEGEGFRFVRAVGRPWNLPSPVRFFRFPDQTSFRFQNSSFLAALESDFQSLLDSIYHLGPLRDLPSREYGWTGGEPSDLGPRGERWIHALLAARKRGAYISPGYRRKKITLEQRVALWLQQLGLIHSFTVEPIAKDSGLYKVKVQSDSRSTPVLIPDVGFGVSQILPVLIILYYVPEGSVVLLEQPEIHLHPSVQSGLADVLLDAVKNRNIQVVIESHSEHLLHRLTRRVAEDSVNPSDLALYFVSLDKDRAAVTNRLVLNMFGEVENWPKDFFGDDIGDLAAAASSAAKRKLLGNR